MSDHNILSPWVYEHCAAGAGAACPLLRTASAESARPLALEQPSKTAVSLLARTHLSWAGNRQLSVRNIRRRRRICSRQEWRSCSAEQEGVVAALRASLHLRAPTSRASHLSRRTTRSQRCARSRSCGPVRERTSPTRRPSLAASCAAEASLPARPPARRWMRAARARCCRRRCWETRYQSHRSHQAERSHSHQEVRHKGRSSTHLRKATTMSCSRRSVR